MARYRGRLLVWMAVVSLVLAFFLRIQLQWDSTDFLLILGIVLLGLASYVWILFNPGLDQTYGEVESKKTDNPQKSRWKIVRNFYGSSILVLALGISFKILHLTGANELLMLSFIALAILSYFLAYYLSKNGWLIFVIGSAFAMTMMGILFRILFLSGGKEILIGALILLVILFFFIIFKRKSFHRLLVKLYFVVLFLNIFFQPTGYGRPSLYGKLSLAYTHKTFIVDEIVLMLQETNVFLLDKDSKSRVVAFNKSVQRSNWYTARYGNKLGRTRTHSVMAYAYANVAQSILDSVTRKNEISPDQEKQKLLEVGWIAAHQANKISALFNFEFGSPEEIKANIRLEADILVALGKNEEAIQALRKIVQSNPPADIKESVEKKIKQLSSK